MVVFSVVVWSAAGVVVLVIDEPVWEAAAGSGGGWRMSAITMLDDRIDSDSLMSILPAGLIALRGEIAAGRPSH